jgi:carbamoyl-phosphate synthase large subunit
MNILFCSAGRRVQLLKDFKASLSEGSKMVATDMSLLAPAIYEADKFYTVPPVNAPDYIEKTLEICDKEQIDVVTTLIDPEIELLSQNRELFRQHGVEVLAPYEETAHLCFDKYEMFRFLKEHGIPTPETYGTADEVMEAVERGKESFPVFVKPRTGSGSVGAGKVNSEKELRDAFADDPTLIAQHLMTGIDLDADVYVDLISGEAVSVFSKKKLEMKIGGASKTVSFYDPALVDFIKETISHFKFHGPIDMDFFYMDGHYWLNEINPRFGGAYLHAYGCGIDFIRLIENNISGNRNVPVFGNYEEDIAMMMYDAVILHKIDKKR